MFLLFTNGGLRTMTTPYDRLFRQLGGDQSQTVHHILITATREVGSTDTHLEEGVAREYAVLLFAIEKDTAGCMTGRMKNGKTVVAEVDDVLFVDEFSDGRYLTVILNAEEIHRLVCQLFQQLGVFAVDEWFKTILLVSHIDAHTVVEMSVCTE